MTIEFVIGNGPTEKTSSAYIGSSSAAHKFPDPPRKRERKTVSRGNRQVKKRDFAGIRNRDRSAYKGGLWSEQVEFVKTVTKSIRPFSREAQFQFHHQGRA
tara:strand:+ start:142 stop:444 length:303 start_codon:yes stop_codon:yes gene_type:complete